MLGEYRFRGFFLDLVCKRAALFQWYNNCVREVVIFTVIELSTALELIVQRPVLDEGFVSISE